MRRCLLLLVALATIPSTFALPPGEFPIAPLPIGAAPYERRHPEVASSNDTFLAVWEDSRVVPNQPRLWGARVTRGGALLDPTGFPIVAFPPNSLIGSHMRAVVSDGTDFLVVWADDGDHLGLAKVTAAGKVTIAPDPKMGGDGAVAVWTGGSYAVFVTDAPTVPFVGVGVGAATIDRDGNVLNRLTIGLNVRSISVAMNRNKTDVLLGWLEVGNTAIHVAPISVQQIESGGVTPPPAALLTNPGGIPTSIGIASDGFNVFAAFLDEGTTPGRYRGLVLDSQGFPQSPIVTLGLASAFPTRPNVSWNGAEYLVTFKDNNDQGRLQKFAADGTQLIPTPMVVSAPVTDITVASLPGLDDSLVVWNDQQGSVQEVSADIVSPSTLPFHLTAHVLLSASFADRSEAPVVWRGNHYLAAWRDALEFARVVFGRFTADGVPLDGSGVLVGSGGSSAPPSLASNGRTAVIAWLDINGVASSFINEAGEVSRLSYNFPGGLPSVHWNGQQYLVAWRSTQSQLLGLRINGSGQLIDNAPITIAPSSGQPFIGWTGNSYVIAYQEIPDCAPSCGTAPILWAQLVSSGLTAIGGRIQLSEPSAGTPAVADGVGGTLIVWPRTVGDSTTLRGVRVLNGTVLDSLNGFEIGAALQASVFGSAAGWGVVSGPYLWVVSRNGAVSPRFPQFPFVPAGAHSAVVFGGPAPLVVYRRDPVGSEQMMQVVAHYAFSPKRERAAKH